MKKQTAVEWLYDRFLFAGYAVNPEWKEQAKAMEREQMEEAVSNGISKADMVDNRGYFNFDKWYNETYKGGEK